MLALAEIKAATQGFDRGKTNGFEAVENISEPVEASHSTERPRQEVA